VRKKKLKKKREKKRKKNVLVYIVASYYVTTLATGLTGCRAAVFQHRSRNKIKKIQGKKILPSRFLAPSYHFTTVYYSIQIQEHQRGRRGGRGMRVCEVRCIHMYICICIYMHLYIFIYNSYICMYIHRYIRTCIRTCILHT
jgi:hypothetical protein